MNVSLLNRCEPQPLSHNRNIEKRVLIKNHELTGITQFAQAVFPPGESAAAHRHVDMAEVFYVLDGEGEIQVDDDVLLLQPGMCVTVLPGEVHEVRNTGSLPLVLNYFGVIQPYQN